jgi:3-oxoadipate enol-lactonase
VPTLTRPDGAVLRYDDTGGDHDTVVVLSHGLLMDRTMFEPQVEALRSRARCITWDERGHGETQWDGPFTYWDSADDLVAILDEVEVDRAVLVGMSQGGYLSLRCALRHPERVAALVMYDSQAATEDPALWPLYEGMAEAWATDGADEAILEHVAGEILGPGLDAEPWKQRWREQPRDRARQIIRPLLDREDVSDRLGEVACPVLVIHGTADTAIPLERGRAVAEGVPDCRGLVLVEGGTHAAGLSHPDEVNAAVSELLDDL